MAAYRFVEECPINRTGRLLVGKAGRGKTHLSVGIAKALIRDKGAKCVFYDHANLLKDPRLLQSLGTGYQTWFAPASI